MKWFNYLEMDLLHMHRILLLHQFLIFGFYPINLELFLSFLVAR
jgi:hypothetical protein